MTETANFLIKQIRTLDPISNLDTTADLLVVDGILQSFGQSVGELPSERPADFRELDGENLWATPGLVDIHTHFREPGQEWKEDIESASKAAVIGGVTSAVCMANTKPTLDNPSVCESVAQRAREVDLINLYMFGACSIGLKQEHLSPMGQLAKWGVVGFSDDGQVIQNGQFMRRVMEYARTYDLPVIPHAEDCILRQNGSMNEGKISWELGHTGNPGAAEAVMVARDIELAGYTGCRLHLPHISTVAAVELVRRGKERGIAVTAEVCPHHFRLTEEAVKQFGTLAKMAPPLRTEADRQAIIEGLLDGTLDCISTDHAPHAPHEKERPFAEAPFGILGFQTLLSQTLAMATEASLDPLSMMRLITQKPSEILRLPHGSLKSGQKAELTIIDPAANWTLNQDSNASKSQNSPWWGQEQTGRAVMTIRNGKIVHSLL